MLVALDAVFSERHVSRAAARLNLTQSAVSNALTRLRRHFNDPIVTRVGGEMTPTALGLVLRSELTDLLARLREFAMRGAAFDPALSDREFRVIAADFVSYVLMPPLIQRLKAEAPGTKIRLMPYSPIALDQLSKAEADLCISLKQDLGGTLPEEKLYDEALTCIAGTKSSFRGERLTAHQYSSARHAAFIVGEGHINFLRSIDMPREVMVWLPSIGALLEVVAETDCVATISTHIAHRFRERFKLRIFAPPFDVSLMPVIMQHHGRTASDLGLAWLRRLFIEVASELGPPILAETRPDSGFS
ncbi:LysR family transcriptional regulator [Sphingomonas tabacisoli]|uniref:LysR family transcriptional regulator n=1 Tax=Sphingomonas tabacisoli TaxID=2249466 RepID=A0ABW4I2P3_9SPHN